MRMQISVIGAGLALLLSACGGKPAADAGEQAASPTTDADGNAASDVPGEATTTGEPTDTGEQAASSSGLQARDGSPVPVLAFDIDSVPSSGQTLGALPFFSMPTGYGPLNRVHQRAYARFPFRLGDGVHWVEGPSWSARIAIDRDVAPDKTYSALEFRRNLEAVLTQAGAKQVFDGPLLRDIYYGPQLEDEIGGGFIDAVNLEQDTPTRVFVIRQAARNIWVQLSFDTHGAGMVVVDEVPFRATATLAQAFPYVTLPAGYKERNRVEQRDFDMFPFWNGQAFEEVEGRTYAIDFDKSEREYSLHEVRRNLAAMMAEAGGVLVFEGRIGKAQSDSVDKAVKQTYSSAAGYSWDDYDSQVYRIDRADGRQAWVFAKLHYLSAGIVVAEREGFVQTAGLLPADALKRELDADGRVAIQINFATDKADLLPDAQPQIEQVLALLKNDPALRLSIEGHTDNTGGAEHNQVLSEARAASVVAVLTGAGIDASRLQAKGLGQGVPVAGNDDEPGRAKNRRVELVKR